MPKNKPTYLSALGQLITNEGLSISFIIEKSGINRNRLGYLRTSPNAVLSLEEAGLLAPVFKLSIDELASKLGEIEKELRKTQE